MRYQESTSTKTARATFDGTTIKIGQPQIIARTGMLLAKTPDPDPTLSWHDDAWIPKKEDLVRIKALRAREYARALLEERAAEEKIRSLQMLDLMKATFGRL